MASACQPSRCLISISARDPFIRCFSIFLFLGSISTYIYIYSFATPCCYIIILLLFALFHFSRRPTTCRLTPSKRHFREENSRGWGIGPQLNSILGSTSLLLPIDVFRRVKTALPLTLLFYKRCHFVVLFVDFQTCLQTHTHR